MLFPQIIGVPYPQNPETLMPHSLIPWSAAPDKGDSEKSKAISAYH
jgi:hypothetical protein